MTVVTVGVTTRTTYCDLRCRFHLGFRTIQLPAFQSLINQGLEKSDSWPKLREQLEEASFELKSLGLSGLCLLSFPSRPSSPQGGDSTILLKA